MKQKVHGLSQSFFCLLANNSKKYFFIDKLGGESFALDYEIAGIMNRVGDYDEIQVRLKAQREERN
jgi:hypothetical protein